MNNADLIQTFVESLVSGRSTLLSNSELMIEPIGDTLQLLAKGEGLVATSKTMGQRWSTAVRSRSNHWYPIHQALITKHLLPLQPAEISGFYQYQHIEIPDGYQVHFTGALDLLQTWWSYEKPDKTRLMMSLLILNRGIWYPIRNLITDHGSLIITTLGTRIKLHPLDHLVWLQQRAQPAPAKIRPISQKFVTNPKVKKSKAKITVCQDGTLPDHPNLKQIGNYLVDAGLLSPAQVEVALNDQKSTGMRFGEILVNHGWIKEQTVEYLMENVILPQRAAAQRDVVLAKQQRAAAQQNATLAKQKLVQRLKQANRWSQRSQRFPVSQPTQPSQPSQSAQSPDLSQPTAEIHARETLVTYEPVNLELDDSVD